MRTRRVYRVTATWAPEHDREPWVRCYLSQSGADKRATAMLEGRDALTEDWGEVISEAIPPATSVVVEPSDPVTWPTS